MFKICILYFLFCVLVYLWDQFGQYNIYDLINSNYVRKVNGIEFALELLRIGYHPYLFPYRRAFLRFRRVCLSRSYSLIGMNNYLMDKSRILLI